MSVAVTAPTSDCSMPDVIVALPLGGNTSVGASTATLLDCIADGSWMPSVYTGTALVTMAAAVELCWRLESDCSCDAVCGSSASLLLEWVAVDVAAGHCSRALAAKLDFLT